MGSEEEEGHVFPRTKISAAAVALELVGEWPPRSVHLLGDAKGAAVSHPVLRDDDVAAGNKEMFLPTLRKPPRMLLSASRLEEAERVTVFVLATSSHDLYFF